MLKIIVGEREYGLDLDYEEAKEFFSNFYSTHNIDKLKFVDKNKKVVVLGENMCKQAILELDIEEEVE